MGDSVRKSWQFQPSSVQSSDPRWQTRLLFAIVQISKILGRADEQAGDIPLGASEPLPAVPGLFVDGWGQFPSLKLRNEHNS
ncbi:hypothetical protein GQ600_26039 [Phytophthora cactorum]|nr:hypothetical protein GQ600_26039 [Phytophthora cactorum]